MTDVRSAPGATAQAWTELDYPAGFEPGAYLDRVAAYAAGEADRWSQLSRMLLALKDEPERDAVIKLFQLGSQGHMFSSWEAPAEVLANIRAALDRTANGALDPAGLLAKLTQGHRPNGL